MRPRSEPKHDTTTSIAGMVCYPMLSCWRRLSLVAPPGFPSNPVAPALASRAWHSESSCASSRLLSHPPCLAAVPVYAALVAIASWRSIPSHTLCLHSNILCVCLRQTVALHGGTQRLWLNRGQSRGMPGSLSGATHHSPWRWTRQARGPRTWALRGARHVRR